MSEPARAAAPPSSIEDRRAERKPKSHQWTRWLHEVRKRHRDLDAKELAVLGELVRRADNESGECWGRLGRSRDQERRHDRPSLVKATGLSRASVQRAIRGLVDRQLIHYKPGGPKVEVASRFRLLPLEEGVSLGHPGGISETPPAGDQTETRGASDGHPTGVTETPLTAFGTTRRTEPPRPPAGGRGRDDDRYEEALRVWAAVEDLPVDERGLQLLRIANKRYRDAEAIAAYVVRFTTGPDGEPPAEISTEPPPSSAGEQLTFGGDAWS
jgi:hypothetical protein